MFPNLLHVTCLAHGVHRLGDFIQIERGTVGKFLFSTEKIVIKIWTPEARFQEQHWFVFAS